MAGQGRRHRQLGRHPGRDRDRQGDDGVRGGRRGHDRQDPRPRRHRRGEGRHRHRADRRRRRGCVEREAPPAAATASVRARSGTGSGRSGSGAAAPARHPRPSRWRLPRLRRATAATGSRRARSPVGSPKQQGIDLAGLSGSGPGGRIVKADVEARPARRLRADRGAAAAAAPPRRRGAGLVDTGHPARGGQAHEHAQDDRAPPDRGQADRSRTST